MTSKNQASGNIWLNLCGIFEPRQPYRNVPLPRVWFLHCNLVSKRVIYQDFAHFGLELGKVFEDWTYLLFQFQMNQKERVMCEFKMGFKKPFCLSSRKWWPYFYLPGLKTGMDLRGQVWKWVWKITFFALKYRSGFEEPSYKPSSKIPGNTPRVFELKLLKINGC